MTLEERVKKLESIISQQAVLNIQLAKSIEKLTILVGVLPKKKQSLDITESVNFTSGSKKLQ